MQQTMSGGRERSCRPTSWLHFSEAALRPFLQYQQPTVQGCLSPLLPEGPSETQSQLYDCKGDPKHL